MNFSKLLRSGKSASKDNTSAVTEAGRRAIRRAVGRAFEALEIRQFLTAVVSVDKADYYPGDTARITGSGYKAGEIVEMQVRRTDGIADNPPGNLPWRVQDGVGGFEAYQDANGMWWRPDLDGAVNGAVESTWSVLPDYLGSSLELTATGLSSGDVAQAQFTDSPKIQSVTVGTQSTSPNPVTAGNSVTFPVTVTRGPGNDDFSADLTVTGLPTGATWSFSENPLPIARNDTSKTVTLTITPASSTSGGSYTFTVRAADSRTYGTNGVPSDFATGTGTLSVRSADTTAPTTSFTQSGTSGTSGWWRTDVGVTLSATDNTGGTGVKQITYSAAGAQAIASTTVSGSSASLPTITAEGQTTISYFATDNAGNVEAVRTLVVKIDKTAPTLTAARRAGSEANAAGWNNRDVTVAFTASDALSGGVSSPADQVFGEGTNQTATATVTDLAGNTATVTLSGINVDKTAPMITARRDTAANAYGWNSTDVAASYSATDALSGLSAGTASGTYTFMTEGAGQSHTFTVTDLAGNTASGTVSNVNIDKTKPTIAGAATTAPNAAGWYNGDVTIAWNTADGLSGIDPSTVPSSTLITGEGSNLSASAGVSDKAGNTASAAVAGVKIDRTAPGTSAGVTAGTAGSNGWYTTAVTLGLTGTDNLSGVTATYYTVDGGAAHPGTSVNLADPGEHAVEYWSVDAAGNAEPATALTVKIDKTAPVTTAGLATSGGVYAAGTWTTKDVSITLGAADQAGLSGVSQTYYRIDDGQWQAYTGAVTFSNEGVHAFSYYSTDVAGNAEAAQSVTVRIDKTAPTATAVRTAANGYGWNNADVTVNLTAADALSGLLPTQADQSYTFGGEGSNLEHTFTVVDGAGNRATFTLAQLGLAPVNIDRTAPTISGSPDRTANSYGWYNRDVTVSFTGADGLSGVAAITGAQVLGEGADQSVTGTVTDRAGNATTFTVAGINIDKTAPTITATRDLLEYAATHHGWNNADVTAGYSASDGGAGLESAPNGSFGFNADGAGQSHTFTVTDKAGNSATATVEGVNIDKMAPTLTSAISRPGGTGWYNLTSGPATVAYNSSDAGSGLAEDNPAPYVFSDGTALAGGAATIYDVAGNRASVAAFTGINQDTVAPTLNASINPAASTGWYNASTGPAKVTYAAGDAGSGVTAPAAYTFGEGANQSLAGITVTDMAGNVSASAGAYAGINVDTVAPVVAASRTGQTYADAHDGWNNTDVTVSFSASDAGGSGVSNPDSRTFDADGIYTSPAVTVTDTAGNVSAPPNTFEIKVDKTAPTISGAPDRAPNVNGWYNADVTVSFSASDALSGGLAAPGAAVLGEGAGQSLTRTVTDRAGNSASFTVGGINVDKTAPTISARGTLPGGLPYVSGTWTNQDVTVTLDGADGLSGVDSLNGPVTITAQGGQQKVTGTVVDKAGNTAQVDFYVSLDKSAPVTTVSGVPSGWTNQTVTLTLASVDQAGLSGVGQTFYSVDGGTAAEYDAANGITLVDEGVHTVSYWSVDNAGNVEAAKAATVRIDKTAPTLAFTRLSAANAAGWNNTDVSVTYAATDAGGAGLVSDATGSTVFTQEGAGQTWTVTVTDAAGNSTTRTFGGVNIDKTAPVVSPIDGLAVVVPGQTVTFTSSAADPTSGIAATAWSNGAGDTGTGTAFSFTAGQVTSYVVTFSVTDQAGNSTLVSKTVSVAPTSLRDGTLYVGGTNGNDQILINPAPDGRLNVTVNGVSQGLFAGVTRVVAYGLGGDDWIQVAGAVQQPVWLYGGDGNDRIDMGNGGGIALGGRGDDTLLGGSGRDLLIGGFGADQIIGNPGDDILIAAYTAYDQEAPAGQSLFASQEEAFGGILSEWSSGRDYATRIRNLTGQGTGERSNGNFFLRTEGSFNSNGSDQTVFDDSASDVFALQSVDTLTGSAGEDWFLANTTADDAAKTIDKIVGVTGTEVKTDSDAM